MGLVGGGVMGLGMGVFLGAMSDMSPPVTVYKGKEVPIAPIKEQARAVLRQTGEKSLYWCRNFAFITGVFSGSECIGE
jgi:mitochondrial import inner membrane translocase subunit TIM22